MKNLMSLIITLCLISNSLAFAQQSTAAPRTAVPQAPAPLSPPPAPQTPVEAAKGLVDEYIAMQTEPPKTEGAVGKTFTGLGQLSHLEHAVALQVANLVPEDFNLFLFYLMDRYVKKPQEREVLAGFIDYLSKTFADDLKATEELNQGPASYMISNSYSYGLTVGVLLLIGGRFAWKRVFASAERTAAFLSEVEANQNLSRTGQFAKMAKSLSGKVLTNPTLLLLGGGAGYGYLTYYIESHRTHRLDPKPILRVVQANLACELSWNALAAHEKFEDLSRDNAKLIKEADPLLKELAQIKEQAETLRKQFPGLQSLSVTDRMFAKDLARIPNSNSWEEFKSALTDAEQSHDGLCRAMRLSKVIEDLGSDRDTLVDLLDAAKMVAQ